MKELENYLKYIQENYKDEIDYKTLVDGACEGAMFSLGDPHSVFFTDAGEVQSFVNNVTGEYEGIGVTMTMNADGNCEITAVTPRGPADKAGVRMGDVIFKIDGQDITEKDLSEISGMLRGKEGTRVTVVVKRDGVDRTYTITREKVSVLSVDYEMLEGNIGYILLKGFELNSAKDLKDAKAKLIKDGAKSLILDVRNNSGGLVNTAIEIAEEFLSGDVITHFMHKGEVFETISATSGTSEKLKTVLLVNEYSASASEILAAALQDNKAATLVGTTTYGKGVAQIMAYTNDKHPYKLSIYYFLTPDKNNIDGIGIIPDHVVRNSLGNYREEAQELYKTFAPFIENSKPKAGDTGLNVFAAQQRLRLLGHSLELTAQMDDATVSAIKMFQKEQGLYEHGELDFTTMRKIQEVSLSYIENDSKEDLQLKKAIDLLK
jgi:carboxyl-terminal processing protease